MHTYDKICLICPHCETRTSQSINHLETGTPFGPWYCDSCGGGYRGVALGTATTLEKTACRMSKTLDLLKLPPSIHPVYFIVEGLRLEDPRNPESDHKQYHYEEGSCPVNWIRSTRLISHQGNTDPHGIMTFRRSIPKPTMPDECMEADELLINLFPEVAPNEPLA